MSRSEEILNELEAVARHPARAVWKMKEEGKQLVGMFPVYTPEEIVVAAGAVPVGLWGNNGPVVRARSYLQPFACPIMQGNLELELNGTYDVLDAVIIPSLCDTLKCMGQKWKAKCPHIQFVHPQNRVLEGACDFLEEEYKRVRDKLGEILSKDITDDGIDQAIDICNQNRSALNRFSDLVALHPEAVSPSARHAVFKSRYFMERAEHTQLVEELNAELEKLPILPWQGKKVVLTGISCEPDGLLEIFDELKIAVAGDDLAQESRQTRTLVPDGDERPLYRLAKMWQNVEGCSLAGDVKKHHGALIIDKARQTGADGVVVCMMKFCDPEEFDYAVYNVQLDKAGIRYLMIDIDPTSDSFEQERTRLQSFVEML